mmetsp:Transcript_373/g.1502  ORF Transcript_373/g.1502 Transcript_373/m.1502 type:complete len:389 (+) Transcript_373:340-1506(+)
MSRRRPHPAAGQDHPRGDRVRVPRQHDPRQPPSRGGSTASGRDGRAHRRRNHRPAPQVLRARLPRGRQGERIRGRPAQVLHQQPRQVHHPVPPRRRHRSRPPRRVRGGARVGEARVRPLGRLRAAVEDVRGQRGRASPPRRVPADRRRGRGDCLHLRRRVQILPRALGVPVGYLPADPGQGDPLVQRGEQRDDLAVSQRHGGDDHDPHASQGHHPVQPAGDCRGDCRGDGVEAGSRRRVQAAACARRAVRVHRHRIPAPRHDLRDDDLRGAGFPVPRQPRRADDGDAHALRLYGRHQRLRHRANAPGLCADRLAGTHVEDRVGVPVRRLRRGVRAQPARLGSTQRGCGSLWHAGRASPALGRHPHPARLRWILLWIQDDAAGDSRQDE